MMCSVESCNRQRKARGLCGMHYQRWRHHGDVTVVLIERGHVGCNVVGCDQSHYCKGFCRTHYMRWHKTGDPGEAARRRYVRGGVCEVDGCSLPGNGGRGCCGTHYSKARRVERRAWLNAYKLEHGCIDCGYREHPAALQFDHVRGEKLRIVSWTVKQGSWDEMLAEVAKCEVRCANCHAVRTHA